jgi:hypothetical protein
MLRIDNIERSSETTYKVTYSLSPARTAPDALVWRTVEVSNRATLITTEFVLRSHWAHEEAKATQEVTTTIEVIHTPGLPDLKLTTKRVKP